LRSSDRPVAGIDRGHADASRPLGLQRQYRTFDFVCHETNQLAWQLQELGEAMAVVADLRSAETPSKARLTTRFLTLLISIPLGFLWVCGKNWGFGGSEVSSVSSNLRFDETPLLKH
jgi:hypothetical protein